MSAECTKRITKEQATPAVIVGSGKLSSMVCLLLIHDQIEMVAPFCKAPQSDEATCPVARFYRGEITMSEALDLLGTMYGY